LGPNHKWALSLVGILALGGGIFLKEGNIYKDGTAKEYKIPLPTEQGPDSSHEVKWITSQNAQGLNVSRFLLAATSMI